ncbi:MAG TPA: FliM/FliN family flagellar motor C-terminal domain-containing protein [Bryobacteraceae bacterium]|nr:FliM/FliN family flagellar motor C-terminal domain-containing protein [Bryobacteraceae bacterium]
MSHDQSNLERVRDVPVRFEAILPGPSMRVSELMDLAAGSLIRTARPAGETVEALAAGAQIGLAELVEVNGRRAARMIRFCGGR